MLALFAFLQLSRSVDPRETAAGVRQSPVCGHTIAYRIVQLHWQGYLIRDAVLTSTTGDSLVAALLGALLKQSRHEVVP
jgi:hypothetical protein